MNGICDAGRKLTHDTDERFRDPCPEYATIKLMVHPDVAGEHAIMVLELCDEHGELVPGEEFAPGDLN